MEINIKGNPGTGNTFQEVHIGTVQNYNPNATTVINNNYGDKPKAASSPDNNKTDAEREHLKSEIMTYVSRIKQYVANEWKNRYETTWRSVLDIPEVESLVFSPGKQKNTSFNRNLVANIIYIMCNAGFYSDTNATALTIALEGNNEHSVRQQLAKEPADRLLVKHVKALLQ